jgi:hypothetical protein
MVEPEIAFADLHEDANLAERFLKSIFRAVLSERLDDLEFLEQTAGKGMVTQGGLVARLEAFVHSNFERIEYTEAIEILKKAKKKFEFQPQWGNDLQTEHERYLAEEHVGRPVVVMNYPEQIKAFYMRMNDDEKTVAAMDVLAPGIGEIIGGSQREERLDRLDARMRKMNLVPEHYNWYRDLRRYGSVPHAGFGLGFERLLVYICGLGNIRDAIPYPRVGRNSDAADGSAPEARPKLVPTRRELFLAYPRAGLPRVGITPTPLCVPRPRPRPRPRHRSQEPRDGSPFWRAVLPLGQRPQHLCPTRGPSRMARARGSRTLDVPPDCALQPRRTRARGQTWFISW